MSESDGEEVTPPSSVVDDILRLPRTLAGFLVEGLRWMIAEPVQQGRIRLVGRTWGIRTLAIAAISAAVLGTAVPLVAGSLRAEEDLSVVVIDTGVSSFPRDILWLPVVLLILSTSLMVFASLHSAIWLRVILFVVNALMLLFVGTSDVIDGPSIGTWTAVTCVGALGALHVWRWRARPVWWEGVIALGLVTTVFAVAYHRSAVQSVEYGLDRLPPITEGILRAAAYVPYVLLVVASAAIAKVALSGVTLVAEYSSRRLSTTTFAGILALLLGWRLSTTGWRWIEDFTDDARTTLERSAGAALLIGAVWFVWWLVNRRMNRIDVRAASLAADTLRRENQRAIHGEVEGDEWWEDDAGELRQSSEIENVMDQLDSVAFPIAIALSLQAFPLMVGVFTQGIAFALWRDNAVTNGAQWLVDLVNDSTTQIVLDLVGAGLLLVGGWWSAVKGRRGAAELMAAAGVVTIVYEVTADGAWLQELRPSTVIMDRIGVVVAAIACGRWLFRRRLTGERQAAVVLFLLASSLLNSRDFVSNPLAEVIGTAGLGAAMFGLMWNLFTEGGVANHDSARYPRDSRLMLFLSQVLFGVTVLFWIALSRDLASTYAITNATYDGDLVLGVTLLLVALITTLRNASVSSGSARSGR